MADFLTDKPTKLERAFLIGVQTHSMAAGEADELLLELHVGCPAPRRLWAV